MVDYEGKLTPYHQTAEIALGLQERGIVPGKDVWVTPRIPSAGKETVFHQLMALMSVIESNFQLSERGSEGAISEVVVPMVSTAAELIDVRRRIEDVIELGHKEFGIPRNPDAVRVIPLIEEVPELLGAGGMMAEYVGKAAQSGYSTDGLRVMLGRSDSAMVYGLVSSVIAVKVAISDCYRAAEAGGFEVHPIFGGGALPFRGHVNLGNLEHINEDFAGIRTITVQSGLRYDCGSEEARQVALRARELLPGKEPLKYDDADRDRLTDILAIFTAHYLESFGRLLSTVIALSDLLPRQRDRLARKSAVGYARDAAQPQKLAELIADTDLAERVASMGQQPASGLPRAISYTGALYSIGLPPEFIATGRGLAEVARTYGDEGLQWLLGIYSGLGDDMARAARYANLGTAAAHLDPVLKGQVEDDFRAVAEYLGVEAGPVTADDRRYHLLLETLQPMLKQLMPGGEWGREAADRDLVAEWIGRLGRLRGSLG